MLFFFFDQSGGSGRAEDEAGHRLDGQVEVVADEGEYGGQNAQFCAGADEREAVEQGGFAQGHLKSDCASHGVAAEDDALEAVGFDEIDYAVGVFADGGLAVAGRVAMSGKVKQDEAAMG